MSRYLEHGNKYRAIKETVNGIIFASRKEARRYEELKLLEKAGEITALQLQFPLPFYYKGVKVFTYKADFIYMDKHNKQHVEDTKGFRTPTYKLKKKFIELEYSFKIEEL